MIGRIIRVVPFTQRVANSEKHNASIVTSSPTARETLTRRPVYSVWGRRLNRDPDFVLPVDAFSCSAASTSPFSDLLRFYLLPHRWVDVSYPWDCTATDFNHYFRYATCAAQAQHAQSLLHATQKRLLNASPPELKMLNFLATLYEQKARKLQELLPYRGVQADVTEMCKDLERIIASWPEVSRLQITIPLQHLLDTELNVSRELDLLFHLCTYTPGTYERTRYYVHLTTLTQLFVEKSKHMKHMNLELKQLRAKLKVRNNKRGFYMNKANDEYRRQLIRKKSHMAQDSFHEAMIQIVEKEEPDLWPQFSIFYLLDVLYLDAIVIINKLNNVESDLKWSSRERGTMSERKYWYRQALWVNLRTIHAQFVILHEEIADLTRYTYAFSVFRATCIDQPSSPHLIEASRQMVLRRVSKRKTYHTSKIVATKRILQYERKKRVRDSTICSLAEGIIHTDNKKKEGR